MSKVEKTICASCFVLILIHLIASFFPQARLWGINQLYYFPLEFRLVFTALGLLILVPEINKILVEFLTRVFVRIGEKLKKLHKYLKYSAISLLSLIPFWLLRSKTPLLGDGYLRAGEIELGKLYSITESVDFYLHLIVSRLFGLEGYTTYKVLSCMAGALFVFLILLLCDLWAKEGKEKLFIFLILATMGANQLFFGYIESYTFMYVAMIAYILFSVRYLKQKSGFVWTCLFFLLATGFHLSTLFLLPSLFYLAFVSIPESDKLKAGKLKFTNMVILICVLALIGLGLYILKIYSPEESPGSFLIYPFGGKESFYPFWSLAHILDFLNHQLLIAPVTMLLWIMLLIFFRKEINFRENVVKFLFLTMVCSFALAFFVDPKLGYPRDWDLFAFTGIGAMLLGLYLLLNTLKERSLNLGRVMLMLFVTSLIFTLPWIWVNASEEKAIARFEDLLKLDEKRAAHGYENLACYYRDKGEHEKTIRLWQNAVALSPISRYYSLLGNAYLRLKRYDETIQLLERAIQMAPDRPYVHNQHKNLGIALAEVGRLDEAVSQLKKAISLEPGEAEYYHILGNILGRAKRYEEAIPCFETVLKLDPGDITVYKMLGIANARIGKKEEAKRYLEAYLKSMPRDASIVREMIDSIQIEIENNR